MKKLASFLLVLAMILSMGTLAFADGTTTLSTTVPAAQYTLNIPADQTIPFGATTTEIGTVTVSDSSGFAEGKNLNVTLTYAPFSSTEVSTTIPFYIRTICTNASSSVNNGLIRSGDALVYKGLTSGEVTSKAVLIVAIDGKFHYLDHLNIEMHSTDWGKALGGDYTAQITFTSEVVVAE